MAFFWSPVVRSYITLYLGQQLEVCLCPPIPLHPSPTLTEQPATRPFSVISKLPLSDLYWSSGTAVHDELAWKKKRFAALQRTGQWRCLSSDLLLLPCFWIGTNKNLVSEWETNICLGLFFLSRKGHQCCLWLYKGLIFTTEIRKFIRNWALERELKSPISKKKKKKERGEQAR